MQAKNRTVFLVGLLVSSVLHGAQKSPMNAQWFSDTTNPYKNANDLIQKQDWQEAERLYALSLEQNLGDEYDQSMARLNMASCHMAQRKASSHWKSFDDVIGIPKEKQLPNTIDSSLTNKNVVVRTDLVGIGDIVHFFAAAEILKQKTGAQVTIALRKFLIPTLVLSAQKRALDLVDEKNNPSEYDYETHIVGLLGHLALSPSCMAPEKPLTMDCQKGFITLFELIAPHIENNKKIVGLFLGEKRQATLIGGRLLPENQQDAGRELQSASFEELLKANREVVILDCGTKDSRLNVLTNQERVLTLPDEDKPFDSVMLFAHYMNKVDEGQIVCFAADQGPSNVFSRALTKKAQNNMAFIIPNAQARDMRMQGEGDKYRQMISNCWVYVSKGLDQETQVVDLAYQEMISQH
jgi:hypothetical protein